MQARPKLGIAAGACSILLAGAAMSSDDGNSNSITITLEQNESVAMSEQMFPQHNQTSVHKVESIGLNINFSAFPDAVSENMLQFNFNDTGLTIYVPTEIQYSPDEMLSISGTVSEKGQDHLTLTNAVIIPITESPLPGETPSEPTEKTPQHSSSQSSIAPQEQNVYVSSSGKYHKVSDCSGMKTYTEMTLSEAIDAGCSACKKCS